MSFYAVSSFFQIAPVLFFFFILFLFFYLLLFGNGDILHMNFLGHLDSILNRTVAYLQITVFLNVLCILTFFQSAGSELCLGLKKKLKPHMISTQSVCSDR